MIMLFNVAIGVIATSGSLHFTPSYSLVNAAVKFTLILAGFCEVKG